MTAISGPHTSDIIDFLGQFGFDAIWIEAEHGPVDYADIPDMTRACDLWDMTSIVRVNQNVDGIIYRTLDVGAQGVVVQFLKEHLRGAQSRAYGQQAFAHTVP